VASFMLGITNHWMCLKAVKIGKDTQYWFFDSFNRQVLDLSEPEIYELVERMSSERIKFKGEPFSEFFKKNIPICFKDTQLSLKLIVDCLEGRATIEQYSYNQLFNVFARHLEKCWDNQQELLLTIKDYWYNITSFLRQPVQHHLFTPQNTLRFTRLVEAIQGLKGQSDEGKRLYQMVKKYETKTCI
jgi:hypothetical protein